MASLPVDFDHAKSRQLGEDCGNLGASDPCQFLELAGAELVPLLPVSVSLPDQGQDNAVLPGGQLRTAQRLKKLVGNARVSVLELGISQ